MDRIDIASFSPFKARIAREGVVCTVIDHCDSNQKLGLLIIRMRPKTFGKCALSTQMLLWIHNDPLP